MPCFRKNIFDFCFESETNFGFSGQFTAEIWEKFWKIVFRKKGAKSQWLRRPSIEISSDPWDFYQNFVKKAFRGRRLHIDNLEVVIQKYNLEIWKKVLFSFKIMVFKSFLDTLQQKPENQKSKTLFRKKGIKSRWGGPRPKFRVTHSFFIESCWKKNFEVGDPLSTIWGLYFKNRNPKFPPTRKKRVFSVADFFEKSRK